MVLKLLRVMKRVKKNENRNIIRLYQHLHVANFVFFVLLM